MLAKTALLALAALATMSSVIAIAVSPCLVNPTLKGCKRDEAHALIDISADIRRNLGDAGIDDLAKRADSTDSTVTIGQTVTHTRTRTNAGGVVETVTRTHVKGTSTLTPEQNAAKKAARESAKAAQASAQVTTAAEGGTAASSSSATAAPVTTATAGAPA